MSKIKHWLTTTFMRENRCYGVSVSATSSGAQSFDVVLLQRKGTNLHIEQQWIAIDSTDVLVKTLNRSIPIMLNCDMKGILHKKIIGAADSEPSVVLNKILPNASAQDFYVQQQELSNNEVLVSIARRDTVDALVQQLASLGLQIIGIGIGINVCVGFEGMLKSSKILLPNWLLEFNEQGILKEFSRNGSDEVLPCNIADETIHPKVVLAYFAAIRYFTDHFLSVLQPDQLIASHSDFTYKVLLKKGSIGTVSLVLVLLLVNYLAFDHFYKRHIALEDKLSSSIVLLQTQKELKAELEKKKALIINQGFDAETKNAYFADRLAYSIPSGIVLDEMRCFVPKDEAVIKKKQEFCKYIATTGTVSSSVELNDWVIRLKNETWVDSVQIVSYAQKEAKAIFTVKISIKQQ